MAVKSPMTARRPIELQTRLTILYLTFFGGNGNKCIYPLHVSLHLPCMIIYLR